MSDGQSLRNGFSTLLNIKNFQPTLTNIKTSWSQLLHDRSTHTHRVVLIASEFLFPTGMYSKRTNTVSANIQKGPENQL